MDNPGEREEAVQADYTEYQSFLTNISPDEIATEASRVYQKGNRISVFVEADNQYAITAISHPEGYKIYPHNMARHRLIIIPDIPVHRHQAYILDRWQSITDNLTEWCLYRCRVVCDGCSDQIEAGEAEYPMPVNVCHNCSVSYFRDQITGGEE